MISEQNMAYGVSDLEQWRILFISFSRVRVMVVSVDFGGRYILIGCRFHREHGMHKSQGLILIRALALLGRKCLIDENGILSVLSRSPTMAGGLLAAHREYFFEIGGYGKRLMHQMLADCSSLFCLCLSYVCNGFSLMLTSIHKSSNSYYGENCNFC